MPESPREGLPGPPPRPTWVKFAAIGVAVLVVAAIVVAIVGGDHGPGRHLPGGGGSDETAPAQHTPPVEHGG